MTETLFAFDERNYLNCQSAFRGAETQEYYLGDYSIEAGATIDVRAERKAVGACSIIRLRSMNRLLFRRSWLHIREDATDVTVLWFVKRGRMSITHQSGCSVADAGDFVISRSTTPFFMECQPDQKRVHEVLHIIVPTHVLTRFMPHVGRTGIVCIPTVGRKFAIAERIFKDIFEDADELAERTSRLLIDSALCVLSDALKANDVGEPERQTLGAKRLKDAFRFIDIHISDPKLNITAVANGCGISARYLSFLLQIHGTPYSRIIWSKRLEIACRRLAQSSPKEASIAEIAYQSGFKSPAHFSRMFKRVYKMNPTDYRAERHSRTMSESRETPPRSSVSLQ